MATKQSHATIVINCYAHRQAVNTVWDSLCCQLAKFCKLYQTTGYWGPAFFIPAPTRFYSKELRRCTDHTKSATNQTNTKAANKSNHGRMGRIRGLGRRVHLSPGAGGIGRSMPRYGASISSKYSRILYNNSSGK
jgi:hypothetical protein